MGANGSEPSDDAVFKALADATRRDLLDALYAVDGQTLGQLAARHPHLTRFGVMKHLAVLEDAGLIVAEKVGREKRHYLNPVPIAQIAGRWISRYARPFTTALVGLKAGLELADGAVPPDGVDSTGSDPTGSDSAGSTPTRPHCDRVHSDRVHSDRVHSDRVHSDRVRSNAAFTIHNEESR